jgi:WD40 repeat protein
MRILLLTAFLVIALDGALRADAPQPLPKPPAPTAVVENALEVFREECVSCHKTGKTKGGLKLESLEGVKAGGESGPVVLAEKPLESLLLAVLAKDGDPHMPPKKQLSAAQISAVREWLENGTAWDATVMNRPPKTKPVSLKPLPKGVQPVNAIGFSPDGATLAVARGANVELRDAKAERFPVKRIIQAELDTIASLLWSQDSQTIVTGGFRQIRFWNANDGSAIGALTDGLSGEITALCSHGEMLWAADSLPSRGGFIHRLPWADRKIVQSWKAHDDSVYGLAIAADGAWLVTGGADKLARRWNPLTGALAATYEGHTNHVLCVALDPKTPRIATTGADREIKIWDRDTREQDAVLGEKKQVTSAIHWSADGARLATVTARGNGTIFSSIQKHTGEQRSDTAKSQKLEKVDAVLQCVCTNADGSRVAAGGADGQVFVWNGADGKRVPLE